MRDSARVRRAGSPATGALFRAPQCAGSTGAEGAHRHAGVHDERLGHPLQEPGHQLPKGSLLGRREVGRPPRRRPQGPPEGRAERRSEHRRGHGPADRDGNDRRLGERTGCRRGGRGATADAGRQGTGAGRRRLDVGDSACSPQQQAPVNLTQQSGFEQQRAAVSESKGVRATAGF